MSIVSLMRALLQHELRLYARQRSAWMNPLCFFLMVVAMFPIGVSPQPELLKSIAAGIIWVSALLSTLLAAEYLFKQDLDDGFLEQILVSPTPLFLVVLVKVFSHWLVSGLTLTLLSPLLALMLYLDYEQTKMLFITLLMGTPVLSMVSSIGAALTIGIRRGGVLISLIALPLYVPVLIFATGAIQAVGEGYSASAQLALLGAMLVLSITMAPFATAMALRISVSQQ